MSCCEEEIIQAVQNNNIELLIGLEAEFEGILEMVKDTKNKLEPLISQLDDTVMSEYLFNVECAIPTWKNKELRLKLKIKEHKERIRETKEDSVAQALKEIVTSNKDKYKHRPVDMGTSEFPKFDGRINYYHWWAKWLHLAKVSKLNEDNLEVKLRESLVDQAEELMGKTLMATGSFQQLGDKLKAIYDKPIQRVQEVADDFFELHNRKKTSNTIEFRKYVADIEDVLLRVSKEGLTAESLALNIALQKLPDHLKRSVQTELSRTHPDFHLTKEEFNKAFDTVTNRLDVKDEGKVVTLYNNFVSNETNKNINGKNEGKPFFCAIHMEKETECELNSPKKVREYLIKHERCIRCGVAKRNHGDKCRRMSWCPKHYYEYQYHLPRTCEGHNYNHPGCQLKFNNR